MLAPVLCYILLRENFNASSLVHSPVGVYSRALTYTSAVFISEELSCVNFTGVWIRWIGTVEWIGGLDWNGMEWNGEDACAL